MTRRPFAVVAVLGALLSATFLAAPAARAAGTPTQVALIVQKAPGQVIVRCVDHTDGTTGSGVLAASGLAVRYGSGPKTGFVLTIDGYGTTKTDDNTYWSYWRSPGDGGYSYSNLGVTSTRPAAGSVEAWVYYAGAAVQFPERSYASLCPNGFAAAAPAPPPPPPAAGGTGSGGGSGSGGSGTGTTGTTGTGSSGTGSSGTGGSGTGSRPTGTGAPAAGSPGPSGTGTNTAPTPGAGSSAPGSGGASTGAAASSAAPGATRSVAASDVAATTATGGSGTGVTVGLIVAAVAVVGLGGAAVVVRRRRASEE